MRAAVVFTVTLALSACRADRAPAPTAAPSSTTAASAAPKPAAAASENRTLAMSDPAGTRAVDGQIRAQQKRLEKRADDLDALVLLGGAWIKKAREAGDPGFYLNAKACAALVLEVDADNRLALGLVAQVSLNAHEFREAAETARRVLARDAEDVDAYGTLSDALLELGDDKAAVAAADKMIDLKPSLPSYARASFLQWLHGDTKAALESARLAIESGRNPLEPEPRCYALVQSAMIFWHRGDYDGADAGFVKALGELGEYPPALVGRARVGLAKGQFKLAIASLEKAHAQSPLVETAWLLGDAYSGAGESAKAEAAYAKVVRDGRRADHRTLAQFYATKNRDIDEALKLIEDEMKIRPGIYTHDAYGWTLFHAHRLDEARKESDAALALGTKDARLMYHAGAIRIAQNGKDVEQGKALVRDAFALNPKFDFTEAARHEAK